MSYTECTQENHGHLQPFSWLGNGRGSHVITYTAAVADSLNMSLTKLYPDRTDGNY